MHALLLLFIRRLHWMLIQTRQESHNVADALQGNINRMCLTKDKNELELMLSFAIRRVVAIYDYNSQRLYEEGKSHETSKID